MFVSVLGMFRLGIEANSIDRTRITNELRLKDV